MKLTQAFVFLASVVVMVAGCHGKVRNQAQPQRLDGVWVPMRDGVRLAADVVLPSGNGRFPVLVYRTPYGRAAEAEYNQRTIRAAVARGYAVVVNDVRGRYGSEGDFDPYINERRDGYDTIEWAAKQPWSDGRVGMFGLSYPGATQWLAAVEAPPSLKAIVPAMSFASMRRFIYHGGVFDLGWTSWIWNLAAPSERVRRNLPGPKTEEEAEKAWAALGVDHFTGALPTTATPDLRDVAPYYYRWLQIPSESPHWEFGELARHYANVRAAVLNLSGWYDDAYGPDGAIHGFLSLRAAGKAGVPTALLMGSWVHGAFETEKTKSGEREFPPHSAIDYDATVLDWLDKHVKGVQSPPTASVRVYVMGEDRWLESETWPLPGSTERSLFLGASPSRRGGALRFSPVAESAESVIEADPMRPARDNPDGYGAYEQNFFSGREDVAIFETEPLAEDLRVVGRVTLEATFVADVPDFDLFARIVDVSPDGRALNVTTSGQGALRASYRDGADKPRRLVTPGQPTKLVIDRLLTANTFRKGHRVRLILSHHLAPWYARNLQTGALESQSAEARKGTIRLVTGGAASRLRLSVLP